MAVLVALARSTHPLPTAGVTIIATVLAACAGIDPARVALVAATILTNQISIGLSNDAIDAGRDRAAGRTDKPIARGELSAGWAWSVAVGAALISLALGLMLHPLAAAANAVFIAAGWAYNAGLKRTAFSPLPYAIGFAALPAVVSYAVTPPAPPSPWIAGAGAALGIAAHFANVLPDLDDDRAAGVRGLPQRLGARASALSMSACLAAASVFLVVAIRPPTGIGVLVLATSALLAVTCGVIAWRRPTSRLVFALTVAAGLLAAILLALSGSALSGRG